LVQTSVGLLPGEEGYNCWSWFWLIKSELELCLIFGTGSRIGARIYTVKKLDLELDSGFHFTCGTGFLIPFYMWNWNHNWDQYF
jgi:hypothetical protein